MPLKFSRRSVMFSHDRVNEHNVVMEGAHWVIMGEMGELGPNSEQYHLKVANHAKDIGIDKLFVISKHSQGIKKIFGNNLLNIHSPIRLSCLFFTF